MRLEKTHARVFIIAGHEDNLAREERGVQLQRSWRRTDRKTQVEYVRKLAKKEVKMKGKTRI